MLGAFASGIGGATPWGAAAGALSAAASTPNTSATGDVSTGAVNIGGIDFGPSGPDHTILLAGLGVAVVMLGLIALRRR